MKDHKSPNFLNSSLHHQSEEQRRFIENLPSYETISEYTKEEARQIESEGVIAWRESDQGWGGLFCKNGKEYIRCNDPDGIINLPLDQREAIRNNTLPGWQCIYCGLGHRVMIREDYYPRFQSLTYGGGKKCLFNEAFGVLKYILISEGSHAKNAESDSN